MKKIFLFIAIGLFLIAIPATIYLLGQQKNIRAQAAPATTLSLSPATQSVNVGASNIKFNVQIDPGKNQVVSADIYITYDVTKLTATSITNGPNAPRVLNSGKIENGIASIRVGAASNTKPISTPGAIAIVTFTAKGATTAIAPASIQFASNTFVGGLRESTANVLVGSTGAKITITDVNATPTVSATPTQKLNLTPTLMPTLGASGSAQASASAIQILSPEANADVTSLMPTFQGKAPPGSTVTIVIYSTAQTVIVTANANGTWTYTPAVPLESGPHNIVASIQTASGTTQATSSAFVIAGAGQGGGVASDSAMPISGNVETTLILIGIGMLLLISGALVPIFI